MTKTRKIAMLIDQHITEYGSREWASDVARSGLGYADKDLIAEAVAGEFKELPSLDQKMITQTIAAKIVAYCKEQMAP